MSNGREITAWKEWREKPVPPQIREHYEELRAFLAVRPGAGPLAECPKRGQRVPVRGSRGSLAERALRGALLERMERMERMERVLRVERVLRGTLLERALRGWLLERALRGALLERAAVAGRFQRAS